MKSIIKFRVAAFLLLVSFVANAQNKYYFPNTAAFDPKIPTPEQFLGYPIGSHFTRYDKVLEYYKELAKLSNKVKYTVIGKSHEERDVVILTITSPENQNNLENIRKEHLKLADPTQSAPDYSKSPVIIFLGYGIHGNETSSTEAALLAAYYLVATQDADFQKYLKDVVVHINPAQNPDGRDHATNWVNTWKSFPPVADSYDKEHNEAWPGARGNHYAINLNRDFLNLVSPEIQAETAFLHQWLPNIFDDYHEMGANSTYYFEPSKPVGTWNHLVPESNYEKLNLILANHFSKALDNIGSLYFTKEQFDNIAPIYGSTYPDIIGGVGTTLEQASSRGLLQENNTGKLDFAYTVKNQLVTSLATIIAGYEEKITLLKYQKDFYGSALDLAKVNTNKAFVFGDKTDQSLTQSFLDLLLKHHIQVYELPKNLTIGNKAFETDYAYIVPTQQPQYRLVHSIFEENTAFKDSLFMDLTAWSVVHAYGIKYAKIKDATVGKGNLVLASKTIKGEVVNGQSQYAYILDWTEFSSYKALYALINAGVITKTAFKPFTAKVGDKEQEFGYGSIVIAVADQKIKSDSLYSIVNEISAESGLKFYGVGTGFSTKGIDLGSGNIRVVREPKVALLTGQGVTSTEAGEAWYALNQYLGYPVTKLDVSWLERIDLDKYNTLVLVSGSYNSLSKNVEVKIKKWVAEGNVLIASADASEWVVKQKIVDENLLDTTLIDKTVVKDRTDFVKINESGENRISGSIFTVDLDITNPIGFGLKNRSNYVFREGLTLLTPTKNQFGTIAKYTNDPLVSGYVSKKHLAKIKNSAAIDYVNVGGGTVILFSDNPNFRATWLTTSRLFLNAVLFGNHLSRQSRY